MEDQTRQQEISHLQQQVQRQPKGPTNIRKLIMSANTREWLSELDFIYKRLLNH